MGFFRRTPEATKPVAGAAAATPSLLDTAASAQHAAEPHGSTSATAASATTTSNNYGATAPPASLDETLLHQQQQQRPGIEAQPSYFRNLNPANPAPMPPLNPREERTHKALQRIQYVMDDAVNIPVLNRRVGLDPLIGLVPGIGDFGSAIVSLVMVARAAPHLSRYTVIRMLINVWIDAVTGVVPIVGDVFDIGWKANQRNLALFEDHMKVGAEIRNSADKRWLIMMIIGFLAFVCVMTCIILALIILLIVWLTGNLN
jgi:Domain of unknown function (DUF4112)